MTAAAQSEGIAFRIRAGLARLARADTVFYLLPALMILLTAGTLAQRWMGLYAAHRMFFASFVFWAGPVPLPGGFTLLAALGAGLALKLALKSVWSLRRSGIILTHMGALVLLAGGLATALSARESFMLISEGGESAFIYDYNARSLKVFEGERELVRFPYARIERWDTGALPFRLGVAGWCDNCSIVRREETEDFSPEASYRGMARFMALRSAPPEKEPEANLSGLSFTIDGAGKAQDGLYLAFDGMPEPVVLEKDGRRYTIVFGKDQRRLPFSIALEDFRKTVYGGTAMASAYHSDVIVRDGAMAWPVRIEMNKPLRYRGYTFYQSSFEEGAADEEDVTILAVVENKGRLFPYIGTLVIGAGLLLHLFIAFTGAFSGKAPGQAAGNRGRKGS